MYLITIPHACTLPYVPDPGCDRRAREFAQLLHKHLGGTILESEHPRHTCDANRAWCRGVAFRKKVDKILATLDSGDVLIDVHTFPRGGLPTLGDVVLFGPLAKEFAQKLQGKVNIDLVIEREPRYDIITQAKIPAVLIEFVDDVPRHLVEFVGKTISNSL